MLNYNLETMSFFATRLIPLAIIWIASLKFIHENEFSNCYINWATYKVEANKAKFATKLAAAFAVIATLVVAGDCAWRAELFPQALLRYAFIGALLVLAASFYILYDDEIRKVHLRCIVRNQYRLSRMVERQFEDGNIMFERKYDITIEPEWRHVAVMSGWFILKKVPLPEDMEVLMLLEEQEDN